MVKMSIGEAKLKFAEILDMAQSGKTIIITEGKKRIAKAQLGPIKKQNKRKLGFMADRGPAIIKSNFKMTLEEFLGKN